MTMFVPMFARTRTANVWPKFGRMFLVYAGVARFPTYFASLVRKPTTHSAASTSSSPVPRETDRPIDRPGTPVDASLAAHPERGTPMTEPAEPASMNGGVVEVGDGSPTATPRRDFGALAQRQLDGLSTDAFGGEPHNVRPKTLRELCDLGMVIEWFEIRRDALGSYSVPRYFVPIDVHIAFCEWCSVNIESPS